MIDRQYWTDPPDAPSADTAVEQARATWERLYRDNEAAGRETPVVDVPASLGDVARASVEATTELSRRSRSRSFVVNIDLRALESAYQAEQARLAAEQEQAAQAAAQSMPARAATRSRREVTSKHAAQDSGQHADTHRRDRPVRVRRVQVHRAGDPATVQ